jgi:hypothetical protein
MLDLIVLLLFSPYDPRICSNIQQMLPHLPGGESDRIGVIGRTARVRFFPLVVSGSFIRSHTIIDNEFLIESHKAFGRIVVVKLKLITVIYGAKLALKIWIGEDEIPFLQRTMTVPPPSILGFTNVTPSQKSFCQSSKDESFKLVLRREVANWSAESSHLRLIIWVNRLLKPFHIQREDSDR